MQTPCAQKMAPGTPWAQRSERLQHDRRKGELIRPTFGAKTKKKQLTFRQNPLRADRLRILTETRALSEQDENYFASS